MSFKPSWVDNVAGIFFRVAASGIVPASLFLSSIPKKRAAKTDKLTLELVSHCWQYSHLLTYQLSSIVNYAPANMNLVVTVFYAEEDRKTKAVLDFFSTQKIQNIEWNWQALPKEKLFRRGIGRNQAAKASKADWVWFTDCDIVFHQGCFDGAAKALHGRDDILLFPRLERTTDMLAETDPMLLKGGGEPQVIDIDTGQFTEHERKRAKGAFQITHGDVARACGYCEQTYIYQTPSDHWCKAYEDRAYRWLLGTDGVAIDVPSVYQIRHITKGRYKADSKWSKLRSFIRRTKSSLLKE